ncbi:MAG: hypothetical protein JWO19_1923 [Bryobacterales bacterium]|nr:hypothetical protein [Bryobacterales bacterium]
MLRFFLAFSGTLLIGSIAAFFLFVPPLLIASVTLLLMGSMLMFWLGVQVGSRSMLMADGVGGKLLSPQAEIRRARP